jgi:hypothetical protein
MAYFIVLISSFEDEEEAYVTADDADITNNSNQTVRTLSPEMLNGPTRFCLDRFRYLKMR